MPAVKDAGAAAAEVDLPRQLKRLPRVALPYRAAASRAVRDALDTAPKDSGRRALTLVKGSTHRQATWSSVNERVRPPSRDVMHSLSTDSPARPTH